MGTKSCLRRTSVTYAQDALAFHESPRPSPMSNPTDQRARTGAHPVLDGQFADDFHRWYSGFTRASDPTRARSVAPPPRSVPLSRTAGPDQVSPKRAHAWRHLNVQPGEWAGVASAGADRLPHSATLRHHFYTKSCLSGIPGGGHTGNLRRRSRRPPKPGPGPGRGGTNVAAVLIARDDPPGTTRADRRA